LAPGCCGCTLPPPHLQLPCDCRPPLPLSVLLHHFVPGVRVLVLPYGRRPGRCLVSRLDLRRDPIPFRLAWVGPVACVVAASFVSAPTGKRGGFDCFVFLLPLLYPRGPQWDERRPLFPRLRSTCMHAPTPFGLCVVRRRASQLTLTRIVLTLFMCTCNLLCSRRGCISPACYGRLFFFYILH
jgi:hypothetical protein